jgi:hypothetical protein
MFSFVIFVVNGFLHFVKKLLVARLSNYKYLQHDIGIGQAIHTGQLNRKLRSAIGIGIAV